MSTFVYIPLVFAFEWKKEPLYHKLQTSFISIQEVLHKTYHASQSKKCGLDLSHVPVLKQIVGLKDVIGLHAISKNGFDEVAQVLKLQWKEQDKWLCYYIFTLGIKLNRNKNKHHTKQWNNAIHKEVFLTLCQLSLEWLVFLMDPGWSLLMSLWERPNITSSRRNSTYSAHLLPFKCLRSVHFPQSTRILISNTVEVKSLHSPFRSCNILFCQNKGIIQNACFC